MTSAIAGSGIEHAMKTYISKPAACGMLLVERLPGCLLLTKSADPLFGMGGGVPKRRGDYPDQ